MTRSAARNPVRRNPSGYVVCDGFDAVMRFIAKESLEDVSMLWFKLAEAAADDHGMNAPRPVKEMNCEWLLKKLEAVTPEAQWDLVSRVEPLFHSAWEGSSTAMDMLQCASELYPPRQENPRIINDQVRLAACDVVETALRYTDDLRAAVAIEMARRYALGKASLRELDVARVATLTSNIYAARAASWACSDNAIMEAALYAASAACEALNMSWDAAEARNAEIVRRSLGTPGLALLMR